MAGPAAAVGAAAKAAGAAGGLGKFAALAGGPVGMAVATGLQVAMGVAQMIKAGKQRKEAEKMQRDTVVPQYKVNKNFYDNLEWAESQSSQGLSDAAMTAYQNNMDRTLTTSIDAILRGGGSVNTIADLADTSFDQAERLALLEDQIRLDKNKMRIQISERVAAEEEKEWQVNTYGPYKDRLQAIAALRGTSSDNSNAGRNLAFTALGNYAIGNKLQPEIDGVYGNRRSGVTLDGSGDVPISTYERNFGKLPTPRITTGNIRSSGVSGIYNRVPGNAAGNTGYDTPMPFTSPRINPYLGPFIRR